MGCDALEPSVSSPVEDWLKTGCMAVGAQRKASGAGYLSFPAWVAGQFATQRFSHAYAARISQVAVWVAVLRAIGVPDSFMGELKTPVCAELHGENLLR